jgi:hypothetical protein
MNKTALLLVAFVTCSGVNAQTVSPPPKVPSRVVLPPASSYCLPVSAGFLESEAKASSEMQKCTRGDTVVIPARIPGAVARMCDFSKAIVALGDNVVCVMILPERGSR